MCSTLGTVRHMNTPGAAAHPPRWGLLIPEPPGQRGWGRTRAGLAGRVALGVELEVPRPVAAAACWPRDAAALAAWALARPGAAGRLLEAEQPAGSPPAPG